MFISLKLVLSFMNICSFYKQRVSVTLQSVQAVTIGSQDVVMAEDASSRLGVLLGFSSISLHNLLPATGDGFRFKVLCFLLNGLPIVCSATFRCGPFI